MGCGGCAITLASFGRSITKNPSFFYKMGYFANTGAFIGMFCFVTLSKRTLYSIAYSNLILSTCCMAIVYSSGLKHFREELEERKVCQENTDQEVDHNITDLISTSPNQDEYTVFSSQAMRVKENKITSKKNSVPGQTKRVNTQNFNQRDIYNSHETSFTVNTTQHACNSNFNESENTPTTYENQCDLKEEDIIKEDSNMTVENETESLGESYFIEKENKKRQRSELILQSRSRDESGNFISKPQENKNENGSITTISHISRDIENTDQKDNQTIIHNNDCKINTNPETLNISDISTECLKEINKPQHEGAENNSLPLIFLVLLPLIAYFLLRDQYLSTWCDQAEKLKPTAILKAHHLPLFYSIFIFILTPYLSRLKIKTTHKLICGYSFGVLSYFICFMIEFTKWPVTVQLIPYFFLSVAEILCYTVSHEYSYLIAPKKRRFFTISILRLCSFAGNLLVSIINSMEILSSLKETFFLWGCLSFVGLVCQTILLLRFDRKFSKNR